MTDAERKLLLAVADAVLTMARLRSPPMSTKELEAEWAEQLNERRVTDCLSQVRETLDEEAHQVALSAHSGDRLAAECEDWATVKARELVQLRRPMRWGTWR